DRASSAADRHHAAHHPDGVPGRCRPLRGGGHLPGEPRPPVRARDGGDAADHEHRVPGRRGGGHPVDSAQARRRAGLRSTQVAEHHCVGVRRGHGRVRRRALPAGGQPHPVPGGAGDDAGRLRPGAHPRV
ncbi:MAG: hypothetical protein AVDCRST_MAG89-2440, partial [uncultured Gemmatimonadetes bacterium]